MPDTPTRAEHRERSEEHVAEARRMLQVAASATTTAEQEAARSVVLGAQTHATLALAVATQGLLLPDDPEPEQPSRGFPHPTPRPLPPGRRP